MMGSGSEQNLQERGKKQNGDTKVKNASLRRIQCNANLQAKPPIAKRWFSQIINVVIVASLTRAFREWPHPNRDNVTKKTAPASGSFPHPTE